MHEAARNVVRRLRYWQALTVVLAAALLAVAVWPSRPEPRRPASPRPQRRESPAPSATSGPARREPEWLDQRLYDTIAEWAKLHPDEHLVAIRMYRGAVACMRDTTLIARARAEIERLERGRRAAAAAALVQARRAAGEFARDGDYDAAVAVFDNIPRQFADLIGPQAKAARAGLAAEARQKILAVLTVARRYGERDDPAEGLAALGRMGITYTPMLPQVQKLRDGLLAQKRKLDARRRQDAVARANEGLDKLIDAINAVVANGDLAGAARLGKAALADHTLEPIQDTVKRLAAATALLLGVKAKPAGWKPANGDEAVAGAMLALAARDADVMAAMLDAAKDHPLRPRYRAHLARLQFKLGRGPGIGSRHRPVRITGADRPLENAAVKVRVHYDADMRRDYADLRFFDTAGRALNYWIETSGKEEAVVWVRVPDLPTTGATIALRYGDPAAKPVSDGRKVFTFFDDFANPLDAKTWEGTPGSTSVKDGVLTVSGGDNNHLGWLDLRRPLPGRLSIEMRLKVVRGRVGMHGGMALFAENETCSHQGWALRNGLAGIEYNYDPYNRGENNPNPKSFCPTPLKQGLKLTPFWNDTWFRQTLAYDGTAERDNIRLVRDKDGKPETLVHTGRRTDRRVKLVIQPWSWSRARIEMDWIAVRPYVVREPVASVGEEVVVGPAADRVRKGLVARWTADGDARDSAGTHHGAIKGNVTYTPDRHGKPNRAFLLDGGTGYIQVDDGRSTLQLTGNLTYAAWVKTTARQMGVVVGRYTGNDANRIASHLTMSRVGTVCMGICGPRYVPGQTAGSGDIRVNDGRWHHVAAVYQAGKSITVYVDGKQVGQNTTDIFPTLNPRPLPVCIGSRVPRRSFQGAIDDVRIYNRGLSADDVRRLHKLP